MKTLNKENAPTVEALLEILASEGCLIFKQQLPEVAYASGQSAEELSITKLPRATRTQMWYEVSLSRIIMLEDGEKQYDSSRGSINHLSNKEEVKDLLKSEGLILVGQDGPVFEYIK
jgi:hypothetical protein